MPPQQILGIEVAKTLRASAVGPIFGKLGVWTEQVQQALPRDIHNRDLCQKQLQNSLHISPAYQQTSRRAQCDRIEF